MALSKDEKAFLRGSFSRFPRLNESNFRITSPRTWTYNCIAWAAGDDRQWWWPLEKYWPPGAPHGTTVNAFTMMFESRGYIASEIASLEPGYEKVALYVGKDGKVTHAARQLPDGQWTSKLGPQYDVSHTLDALEGPEYGSVAKILKRATSGSTETRLR